MTPSPKAKDEICANCGESWIIHSLKYGICPNASNPNQKFVPKEEKIIHTSSIGNKLPELSKSQDIGRESLVKKPSHELNSADLNSQHKAKDELTYSEEFENDLSFDKELQEDDVGELLLRIWNLRKKISDLEKENENKGFVINAMRGEANILIEQAKLQERERCLILVKAFNERIKMFNKEKFKEYSMITTRTCNWNMYIKELEQQIKLNEVDEK